MPETWTGIKYDSEGVCNICKEYGVKSHIDWDERQDQLKSILYYYREYARNHNNKYDCLVGYSGGKDTAYTLWAVVEKYHMRPLAFTFDHGFKMSPEGEYNLEEVPKLLDVDHLRFTLGSGLRNALCKKGCIEIGDFCYHCHAGVGAMPTRISKQWDIPLQIWGEPTAEYQTTGTGYSMIDPEEQNYEHYCKAFVLNKTPDKMIPEGYELLDMQPLTWPEDKFSIKAIYLGNYEYWDQRQHVEIIKSHLNWKVRESETTYCNWDKVDCRLEDLREYQKYMRRGFGKASFQVSKDIREGRITITQGRELINRYEGRVPSTIRSQLWEIGMDKEEFDSITNKKI